MKEQGYALRDRRRRREEEEEETRPIGFTVAGFAVAAVPCSFRDASRDGGIASWECSSAIYWEAICFARGRFVSYGFGV